MKNWETGIAGLKGRLQEFENLLDAYAKLIEKEPNIQEWEKLSSEQQHEYASDVALEENELYNQTADFYYRAIFLLIYGWFEHWINAHYLQQRTSPDHFFERLKNNLTDNNKAGIIGTADWEEIQAISTIRNLVTHNASLLKIDTRYRTNVENFVRKHPDKVEFSGASYDFGKEGGNYPREIKFTPAFCTYTISLFESFLRKINE